MKNDHEIESDAEYTGHEWDGIKEYNNPLPRWWLWTFYATMAWGLAYTIAFPAWPLINSATSGFLGYSTRAELEKDMEAFRESNRHLDERIVSSSLGDILTDPELREYSVRGGAAVFRTHCSQCHGSGAAGAEGFPNLLDDDWLWGGSIDDIHLTIAHGIRSEEDEDSRYSEMPAMGEFLSKEEVAQVVQYVLQLSGKEHDSKLAEAGNELFELECTACHGPEGTGDIVQGAPNLADAIWLYGSDLDSVTQSVANGRSGVMPGWDNRLTDAQVRQVAVYVHELGGGN